MTRIGEVEFTPDACRAARRLLNWAQMTVATASGVEVSIVIDFERERGNTSAREIALVKRALEEAGVEFSRGEPTLGPKAAVEQTDSIHANEFYERLKSALRAERLI